MKTNGGVIYGAKADAQIQKTVREVARQIKNAGVERGRWQSREDKVQCRLSNDLLAAVDTYTDPSTATARIIRRKANGDMELTSRTITIVNRFENISVDAGTYCKAEWIDGEWQLYAADCPGGSASIAPSASGSIAPEPSIGGP